ncbi:MAG: hypothetical protein ACLGHO_04055, partial [Gammaproteobacteria bacterium]
MTTVAERTPTPAASVSHVTEIDLDQIAALAPAIERLCALQTEPTPFHTWEWLSGWYETFGDEVVPR